MRSCAFKHMCLHLVFCRVLQHWDVFVNVSEVFIMVPALLGLKGNLEMTLASRLSTQVSTVRRYPGMPCNGTQGVSSSCT